MWNFPTDDEKRHWQHEKFQCFQYNSSPPQTHFKLFNSETLAGVDVRPPFPNIRLWPSAESGQGKAQGSESQARFSWLSESASKPNFQTLITSPSSACSSVCRLHPFRLRTLHEYRDCHLYFYCRGRYKSRSERHYCMICHERLPLRSSTLARQPVASRTTASTLPRHGSSTEEGLSCNSKTG
jgi:hypothetical protein